MIWLIILGVLVLIVVSALLKDPGTAFPPNRRRRNLKRGVVDVTRPADDPYPYQPVFVEPDRGYHSRTVQSAEDSARVLDDSTLSPGAHASDCGPAPGDAGSHDSCSESSTSD